MQRPERNEYADYYHTYIGKVPDGDICDILETQREEFLALIESIPADRADYRYAEGKWTVKEVIGHVIDCEHVFGYRALAFARRDPAPLPSMEQDDYVAAGNFATRTLHDLALEFSHQRSALVTLLRSFDDEISMRRGIASGFEFTVRGIAYILAGHVLHHSGVLKERYL